MSEHKDIYAALLAAQPGFEVPEMNGVNKHFGNKYSLLSDVISAVKPALNAAGIVYFFTMETSELGEYVVTTLYHADSGTHMKTSVPLVSKQRDMQQIKSARTYGRRMGLEDLTGVSGREDDDAEEDRKTTSKNPIGDGLKDTWTQSVLDGLPETASPREKAEAFTDAICEGFKGKKEKALKNEYARRKSIIQSLDERFPDLYSKVVDAFENQLMEATDNFTSKEYAA